MQTSARPLPIAYWWMKLVSNIQRRARCTDRDKQHALSSLLAHSSGEASSQHDWNESNTHPSCPCAQGAGGNPEPSEALMRTSTEMENVRIPLALASHALHLTLHQPKSLVHSRSLVGSLNTEDSRAICKMQYNYDSIQYAKTTPSLSPQFLIRACNHKSVLHMPWPEPGFWLSWHACFGCDLE